MRRQSFTLALAIIAISCGSGGVSPDAGVWVSSDGRGWAQTTVDQLGGPGAQQMLDLVVLDDLLIAVGYSSEGDENADARVWTSPDGENWEVATVEAAPGSQWITAVAITGFGLVGVGFDQRGSEEDGAIWSSQDGNEWVRVRSEGFEARQAQSMWGVAEFNGKLFAGGSWNQNAAIWSSEDGSEWARVRGQGDLTGTVQSEARIWDMTVVNGSLVAVGTRGDDGAIWASSDGTSWDLVSDPNIFGGAGRQEVTAVVDTRDGPIAVGIDWGREQINFLGRGMVDRPAAALWTSDDGLTWQRIHQDTLGRSDFEEIADVAAWSSGYVAVGRTASGSNLGGSFDDGEPAVWLSNDRLDWERVENDELGGPDWQDLFAVVEFEGRLVAVGGDDHGFTD